MRSVWFSRLFFAVVAATAAAGIISGTACTRWGQPGPITPTTAPLASIYVSAQTGSDTAGSGSLTNPYKTMTKAVAVLTAAKSVAPSGVTIFLGNGDYDLANGEQFPIVVSRNVTITGTNYGTGPATGSFINGVGQDTIFERVVHAPPHSAYATFEVLPPANVNLGDVYVGASKIRLPSSRAVYSSVDVIGALNASNASFGAGIVSALRNVNGILVASGSLTCTSCQIRGNDFGIGALTVPIPTAAPSSSPSSGIPTIMLSQGNGDSTIVAKIVDVVTDGSASVTASGEKFEAADYGFEDALAPIVPVATRGAIDFGGGVGSSTGGNDFIGARVTEISIGRRFETVSALDDTWNPYQQRANRS
jgi:hypothetical protein